MLTRIGLATVLALLTTTGAFAQTMRFNTSVGSFDMELNPNNDPNLQPLVDNIVAYIGLGKYHFSSVNRAADGNAGTADDFVLQMGGFMGFPTNPDFWATMNSSIEKLNDGVVVDADGDGQVDFSSISNTRGTVSLALQSGQPNSGTSSFFINLGDNNFLDSQGFVPFARISNMSTIDKIMQLNQRDLASELGQTGNLALSDVPITADGNIVVVKSVQVVNAASDFSFVGPIMNHLKLVAANEAAAAAAAQAALLAPPVDPLAAPPVSAVPEPSTVALGALGLLGAFLSSRRNRSAR
ncbi:peptidylprolyl isomerase [Lacipirellula sp.]|uniref:peptidylprolyl isomerase n=1 Tax=Lacipirellula sp. TaxID=2691419 RepID=UPI003D0A4128